MRYVTLRTSAERGDLQAIPSSTLPASVDRGAIHQIELLQDDTAVELRSVRGDLAAYRSLLSDTEAVHSFTVTGTTEGYVYAHFEPTAAARKLLEWRRAFPIVLQLPIEFEDGSPTITIVGEEGSVSAAIDAFPDPVHYEVCDTGRYSPRWAAPFRGLTDRQREILSIAVELGYYENPREATQADVANALSLAPGTVGDHLRTIESHVFSRWSASLGGA